MCHRNTLGGTAFPHRPVSSKTYYVSTSCVFLSSAAKIQGTIRSMQSLRWVRPTPAAPTPPMVRRSRQGRAPRSRGLGRTIALGRSLRRKTVDTARRRAGKNRDDDRDDHDDDDDDSVVLALSSASCRYISSVVVQTFLKTRHQDRDLYRQGLKAKDHKVSRPKAPRSPDHDLDLGSMVSSPRPWTNELE